MRTHTQTHTHHSPARCYSWPPVWSKQMVECIYIPICDEFVLQSCSLRFFLPSAACLFSCFVFCYGDVSDCNDARLYVHTVLAVYGVCICIYIEYIRIRGKRATTLRISIRRDSKPMRQKGSGVGEGGASKQPCLFHIRDSEHNWVNVFKYLSELIQPLWDGWYCT